jgi:high-affinity Fe2+/Pb2+ permease
VTTRSARNRLTAIAVGLGLCWPAVAEACAVCFSGRSDETREAFRLTTVFLTFLPLSAVGGVVWWLRRRARQLALAGEAVERANAEIRAGI